MTALAPATAGQQPASLARFRAERRAEAIRADLKGAAAMLREAREEQDWQEFGYASHGAYVLDRFGDVLDDLRLATEDRDSVVDAMRTDGASYSKIQRRLSISAGTVRNILDRVGDHAPEKTVGDDGRARTARTRPVTPVAATPARGEVDRRTVTLVTAAGAEGFTVHELCRKARKPQGAISASLSRVSRQQGPRSAQLVRTTTYRDGCAVYVAPIFVT